ncbi:peptidoglycan-binding protein [Candidatus Kaiserbacteria bacterium]|nr:peptidoglycan-binding protein [Candidatus Kaiserbacteria bacterium]
MRTLTKVAIALGLLAPSLAFAAFNSVSLSATLSVNGITINVSGSAAVVESITVNGSDFSFTMKSGSQIYLIAPNKNVLSPSTAGFVTVDSCDSNGAMLKFTATGDQTVTVTPSSSTCGVGSLATVAATGSGSSGNGPVSSGGGGGGGGGAVVLPSTPITTPASTPAPATPISGLTAGQVEAILSLLSSFDADAATLANVRAVLYGQPSSGGSLVSAFARNLEVGMTGDDVKALQVYLNTHGYAVASSGAGSPGNETNKFGGATKAALIKFQKAKAITPAVGYFGPKTRAAAK